MSLPKVLPGTPGTGALPDGEVDGVKEAGDRMSGSSRLVMPRKLPRTSTDMFICRVANNCFEGLYQHY